MAEHPIDKFLTCIKNYASIKQLNLFKINESDVTSVILSYTYPDHGVMITHNMWYGEEVEIINFRPLEKEFFATFQECIIKLNVMFNEENK